MRLFSLLALLCLSACAWCQVQQTKVIDIHRGSPIRFAVEDLIQKYKLRITYQDPMYECSCDLVDVTPVNKTSGPRLFTIRRRPLHFTYLEQNGKPVEDTTTLLRRLLAEFAAHGGEVFTVVQRDLGNGQRWDVLPLLAHGSHGDIKDQPDLLATVLDMERAHTDQLRFDAQLGQELSSKSGIHVVFDSGFLEGIIPSFDFPGAHGSARDLLTELYPDSLWEINWDPEEGGGKYWLNIVPPPHPPSSRKDPALLAPPSTANSREDKESFARRWAMSSTGARQIQQRLITLNLLQGEADGRWGPKLSNAVKLFQSQTGLPPTGVVTLTTLEKLGISSHSQPTSKP